MNKPNKITQLIFQFKNKHLNSDSENNSERLHLYERARLQNGIAATTVQKSLKRDCNVKANFKKLVNFLKRLKTNSTTATIAVAAA